MRLWICLSLPAAAGCAGPSSAAANHETITASGVDDDGCGHDRRRTVRFSAGPRSLRSRRSAPAAARRGRTPTRELRATGRILLVRPQGQSFLPRPGRLRRGIAGSSAVHDTSGSIASGACSPLMHHTSSKELTMKRSRRVFLMMMGAAAVTSALPVAALAAPCEPDPRLLRNSNPDPLRQDCTPSRGLPGNRFQQRMRAGG
jgi:hypothetical protein